MQISALKTISFEYSSKDLLMVSYELYIIKMAELTQSEKLNAVIKEIMRTKITTDFSSATKVAEALIGDESKLTEGEKYFKQIIFHKVTDDFIKWFTGDKLAVEFQRLQAEIDALKRELADVRKIAVQGAARGESHSQTPQQTASQSQQNAPVQQQQSQQSKPASSSPPAQASNPNTGRANRDEMKPEEYDISKVFYFGNKR